MGDEVKQKYQQKLAAVNERLKLLGTDAARIVEKTKAAQEKKAQIEKMLADLDKPAPAPAK